MAKASIQRRKLGYKTTWVSIYQPCNGGKFIWENETRRVNAVKDKDVVIDVVETECVGFVGSDVTTEQDLSQVLVETIGVVENLNYALLARPEIAERTARNLEAGEALFLGTSYPVAATKLLGKQAVVVVERSGSIEGLPKRFPWLDGVIELVQTGGSIVANKLTVVATLAPVELQYVRQPTFEERYDRRQNFRLTI